MTKLGFIDTETTGLDLYMHDIWEVGLIVRDEDGNDAEYLWQLPANIAMADPFALNIGKFWERRWATKIQVLDGKEEHRYELSMRGVPDLTESYVIDPEDMPTWCAMFMELTKDLHLVGAVPDFDAYRLDALMRQHGYRGFWHYHLIDIEALMVGWLARDCGTIPGLPWKSHNLSRAVGVDPEEFAEHTALGDARWARAVYDRCTAPCPEPTDDPEPTDA